MLFINGCWSCFHYYLVITVQLEMQLLNRYLILFVSMASHSSTLERDHVKMVLPHMLHPCMCKKHRQFFAFKILISVISQ